MRGVFITFEGIEGSGKSSLVKRLAASLEAPGRHVVATHEPGELSTELRDFVLTRGQLQPLSVALYMLMDRHEHVVGKIRPSLNRGNLVLCDRFTDSTLAYQGGGSGLDVGELQKLNALVVGGTVPVRTYLLDLDVPTALTRVRARSPHKQLDRFESETAAFHERVRNAYLDLAAAEPRRIEVIDARRAADAVFEDVHARVEGLLAGAS